MSWTGNIRAEIAGEFARLQSSSVELAYVAKMLRRKAEWRAMKHRERARAHYYRVKADPERWRQKIEAMRHARHRDGTVRKRWARIKSNPKRYAEHLRKHAARKRRARLFRTIAKLGAVGILKCPNCGGAVQQTLRSKGAVRKYCSDRCRINLRARMYQRRRREAMRAA